MDNFDVDLFAKYLLNDNIGETDGGAAPFDFRYVDSVVRIHVYLSRPVTGTSITSRGFSNRFIVP